MSFSSIAFAVAAIGSFQSKPSSGWVRYEMKPLFMSAEALKKPISVPFRISQGGEDVKVNRWLKWESGSLSVVLGYSENKKGIVNLTEAVNGALGGLAASKGLKLVSRNTRGITISGVVGVKVYAVFETQGERLVYNAVLAGKGKRMWQSITIYEPDSANHAKAEKCLASMRLRP